MNQYMEDYSLSPSHCLSNKMRINSKALKNSDCSSVLLLVFSVMINLCFRNVRVSSSKKRSTIILSSPCKNPGVLGFLPMALVYLTDGLHMVLKSDYKTTSFKQFLFSHRS